MAERSGRYLIEFKDVPSERQKVPELPAKERVISFIEVESDFSQEQAVAEANRCLSCRRCIGCGLCLAVCHEKGIDFAQADKDVQLEVDTIVLTPGVERTPAPINEKFGYGKFANVVTFPEFERIISNSGPYSGMVLRPYDGEIPTKIAFIPTDAKQDKSALSSAGKAAVAAHAKIPQLETRLYFTGMESSQDELSKKLDKKSKLTVGGGEVLNIGENADSNNLIVESVENGKTRKEEFGLVVLLTPYELPADIKELAERLGAGLTDYRFNDSLDTTTVKTAKPGLFFSGLNLIK